MLNYTVSDVTPPSTFLKRRLRLPTAIISSAVLLSVLLLAMLWLVYSLVNRASITLVQGQANTFMVEAARFFEAQRHPPESADLEHYLALKQPHGLRYIALWRPETGILAFAGEPSSALDSRTIAALDVQKPRFLGTRVRIRLGPPEHGPPRPGEGPPPRRPGEPPPAPDAKGDWRPPPPPPGEDDDWRPPPPPPDAEGDWRPPPPRGEPPRGEPPRGEPPRGVPPPGHPPWAVMEFEPLEAQRLHGYARLSLAVGLIVVAAVLGGAAFLIYLVRRRDELSQRIEHGRRLAALGEMAAVIAHEIRNPLTALKGHAQLLQRALAGDPRDEKANRVVSEAVRLEALLNDLLEFARTGVIEPQPVDPARVLHESADAVNPERIIVRSQDAPTTWRMDAARMHQVLTNILRNAVQMSPDGEPVEARVFADDGQLVYEIRDAGPGIPAGEEERIFEPFYTRKTRGTGLGL
ncbi:MAG: hypothetical protein HY270_08290, partial [Deltaproteobacteria bacterium]|nr:hypothetical protein [Deltaproteobacteria bacterium]